MPWMDGVEQIPGVNANNLGNRKQNGRLHYTVGVDSTGIGVNGYFHFLVPKDGTPKQFAPTEAICWDACEWNATGVGIEFERLSDDEPLTDSQILWGGRIIQWLNKVDGIPLSFRDTPDDRMPVGTEYHGFTTHRSLHEQACDEHYDYITQADWDRMTSETPSPALSPRRKKRHMNWIAPGPHPDKPTNWYRDGAVRSYMGDQGSIDFVVATLRAQGESLHVQAEQVSQDFHESFTLVGPDYDPKPPATPPQILDHHLNP